MEAKLRVHARGYRTADVCRFVQDANLAHGRREFVPLAKPEVGWDPAVVEEQGEELPMEKRRTDWSEYLDEPGELRDGCGGLGLDASDGESGQGIEVTTELPQERPNLSTNSTSSKR
ncbi:hypothetical protein BS78_04G089800 [Paspalum vaginatum]|nr:hypothetical protein BS78_04G089800 [Paspalum vaginatum]KAJ1278572.1 hypothetical protein BS78_04G089800 [Paspalum vaginatum]KAJ1278573.1 hypothetical protein BS78_04G089800 [Paspalum vaginatum]KAJ1278574.1 hypothetical protein BS78_04G089800 [Paspalum vaginatum]KAJ1278575.1 hypothetical protein BS78_04G089800 [Paspalum vaginatum]